MGTITQEEEKEMADQISITSPVSVESDCKQRVAYDLLNKIAYHTGDDAQKKDKKYWLTLYCQCHKAVSGVSLGGILKEE